MRAKGSRSLRVLLLSDPGCSKGLCFLFEWAARGSPEALSDSNDLSGPLSLPWETLLPLPRGGCGSPSPQDSRPAEADSVPQECQGGWRMGRFGPRHY